MISVDCRCQEEFSWLYHRIYDIVLLIWLHRVLGGMCLTSAPVGLNYGIA